MDTNNEIIAYGIYEGCIYEGGGTGRNLFKDKDAAVAEAIRIFELKKARDKEYDKSDDEDEDREFMKRHRKQYRWRKCDTQENRWHNTVDEIEVVEYTIK